MFKLTHDQKNTLEQQLRKARDVSERNRICVVLGHAEGWTIEELSKVLRVSHATVYNYLKDFDSNEKTKNDPRGGSESKLSEEQSQSLLRHLETITYLKVKGIIGYVERVYGIFYSRSGMTDWLRGHGFVFKRPKKIPGKLDPEQQKAFIKWYNELKASIGPHTKIFFGDAMHPEYQSQAVCGWIRRGTQKTLQTTGKQVRLHFAGAVSLTNMEIITREYETVDADAMIDFLKYLESKSEGGSIHLILDNARSNKNKKLEEFLKTSRIRIHYLPPYSPNLNPTERLWKVFRETTLYNRYYESSTTFFEAVRSFFTEDIPKMIDILKKRITDNFQAIKLDPIKLTVRTI